MEEPAEKRQSRVEELERQLQGLRSRLEKLGGEVVRADYKVLHLTQEVRRSREAFEFLTGFQNNISRARSIKVLYRIALKSIISELWMKRAVVLEIAPDGGTLKPAESLGYASEEDPADLKLPEGDRVSWSKSHIVNSDTAPSPWIEAVREGLRMPYFVWVPYGKNGRLEQVLVAGTLVEDAAQEPKLADHDLDLFVSVGAILWVGRLNLLVRERLKSQVMYQSLLHRISSMLLQDYDEPTARLSDVMARVGATWSLDRTRLLARGSEGRLAGVTHEWTRDGFDKSDPDSTYPLEEVHRWRRAMADGETIRIDAASALPATEAEPLERDGVRSLLLVPIVVHRAIAGWASFEQCSEERVWTPEDVQLLEVIGGLISRAIGRARDIEERTQLESEYHHSKKMEAVGQLAGGVAHDFNNLLTAIQGYAQLLSAKLPEEYRELPGLKEIVMATEKAASLTRQLLSFSRRDTATTGPVDLNEVISDTMKLLKRMMGEKIEVEFDLGEGLDTIVGDGQQIGQVIMNLAVNARDAMPNGGRLTLSTRQYRVAGTLAQRFTIPGVEEAQVIEVSDTGVGMDEETKERIFEPFFTTKDVGQGTGLGLSIVFSVVRRHGGFVDVNSTSGSGTTFSIYLPVRRPDQHEDPEPVTAGSHVGHETVLVVEDDESVRSMIAEVLESKGYDVLAAGNGREALQELQHSGGTVSLIMTDVVMPDMNGIEMWNELTEQGSQVPVIAMSGYPDAAETGGLLEGAAAYIRKPFGPQEIARAVRRTLDEAQEATGSSTHERHRGRPQ
ncbi:MAG: response regulator [Candidatus Eisenbacteria bacterium]|nr:response regulator [Candidatus Eisenbacteria bacterium]